MRESKFVDQNKEKWSQFEKDLIAKKQDPHLLRSHLVEITDDLSYARTFYKNRSVRIYLNGLAQLIYNNIYRNRKNFLKGGRQFFLEDVPRILFFSRRELLVCFLVLLLSVAIGIFSTAHDIGFARSILGDSYVDMTLENIRNGDPLGVYKSQGQIEMFIYIAINNLKVSMMIFLAGLLASYGAVVIMARNGIMLGVFMYFFYSRGLASEFNLTVWMHGTIEILSMVIETLAGILLGRGLIYPGTLSRSKAFSLWGKRAAILYLSTIPFILFAAFIESFLTRYTGMPDVLKIVLILFSLMLMLVYFVWYPLSKFKGKKDIDLGMPELRPESNIAFEPKTIYSNGQIFLKSIQLFGLQFSGLLRKVFLISILYLGGIFLFFKDAVLDRFILLNLNFEEAVFRVLKTDIRKFSDMYGNFSLLFNHGADPGLYILSSLWLSVLMFTAMRVFANQMSGLKFKNVKGILYAVLFSLIANAIWFSFSGWSALLYIVLSPVLILICVYLSFEIDHRRFSALKAAANGAGRLSTLVLLFILSSFAGMLFILSPLSYLVVWVLELNVDLGQEMYELVLKLIMLFAFIMLSSVCILFYMVQSIFMAYTLNEISTAGGLMENIEQIGKNKKAYGMETE